MQTFNPRSIAVASALAMLAGCATNLPTSKLVISAPASTPIAIEDSRPKIDRESSTRVVGNVVFTVLGDDAFAETPNALVAVWLGQPSTSAPLARNVTLRRFKVEVSEEDGQVDDAKVFSQASQTSTATPMSAVAARFLLGHVQSLFSQKIVSAYVVVEIDGRMVEDSNAAYYKGRIGAPEVVEIVKKTLDGVRSKVAHR